MSIVVSLFNHLILLKSGSFLHERPENKQHKHLACKEIKSQEAKNLMNNKKTMKTITKVAN